MRLHALTMTAIGPFSGTESIDFTTLGTDGLFLLEGPTGSGKSTIIDAITFALYGKVAQSPGSAERLRSHHASATADPVVELVFETGAGIFKVRRTPAHERPKKRGSGSVKVNPSVKIWRMTSPGAPMTGEPLSTRISEADDEILRAIGLTHEQFVQTMVLPQGEFAHFLQSRTEDKKALLQRLFGTEVIEATQQRLAEGRRQAEQRRAAAATAVLHAVHAFAGAVGVDEADSSALESLAADAESPKLLEALTAILNDVRTAATSAEQARVGAAAERLSTAEHTAFAQDLHGRAQRRRALRESLATLRSAASDVEAARLRITRAESAGRVAPAAGLRAGAEAAMTRGQDVLAAARSRLDRSLRDADADELRRSAASSRTEIGTLTEAVRRETQLPVLLTALSDARSSLAELDGAIAADSNQAALIPDAVTAAEAALVEAMAAATAAESVAAELDRALRRRDAAALAAAAAGDLAVEAGLVETALRAWESAQEQLTALRMSWRAGVAGELGQALVVGEACLVCGSVDHPNPAERPPDFVSQEQLDAAEAESTRLRRAADQARERYVELRDELTELNARADALTVDQAEAKIRSLRERLDARREQASAAQPLRTAIAAARLKQTELNRLLSERKVERAVVEERMAALQQQVHEGEAVVSEARSQYESVSARVQALTAQAELQAAAADAIARVRADSDRLAAAQAAFSEALAAEGFEGDDWRSHQLDADQITDLRHGVEQHRASLAAVERELAEPRLRSPDLDEPLPDLGGLEELLTRADQREREATATAGSASERFARSRSRFDELRGRLNAADRVLTETAPAIRVGNLSSGVGENRMRMELTTYVLIRRFGQVIAAANSQLRRMSGGRYQLEHTDTRSGNARSGLGLRVQDLNTGRGRDPATLSGGETFYVSLALALGLADVVRSESGGVDLGTLFVDEGFGSLDPDVLDEVLGVLESLRIGGRAVGVVSHVTELKARVADRIVVRPRADGTSTLTVIA